MTEPALPPRFRPPELAAYPDNFVMVDGYRIRYIDTGGDNNHTPLVLAHGFMGSLNDWRFNVAALAEGRRVVAFDWLGFGRSDKPAIAYSLTLYADLLAHLLDALDIPKASVAAHSMGGKFALTFAILHPQMLDGLILVDTDGFVRDPALFAITAATPLGRWSVELLANPRLFQTFLRNAFYSPAFFPTPAEIAQSTADLRDPKYKAALIALNKSYRDISFRATGMIARVGELHAPTLIVWGDKDRVIAPSHAFLAQQAIADSRLIWFGNTGHFPHVEKATDFNRIVNDFLAETENPSKNV